MIPVIQDPVLGTNKSYDLYSRLFNDRYIFLPSKIEEELASEICAQILFLDKESHDPIKLIISSPGGSIYDGFEILDMMEAAESPIYTLGIGLIASMASLIFVSGDRRFLLPRSRLMLHEVAWNTGFSKLTEQKNEMAECEAIQKELDEVLLKKSKLKDLSEFHSKDWYVNAKDSVKYGFADKIIKSLKEF